jgi:hypothetical protein
MIHDFLITGYNNTRICIRKRVAFGETFHLDLMQVIIGDDGLLLSLFYNIDDDVKILGVDEI